MVFYFSWILTLNQSEPDLGSYEGIREYSLTSQREILLYGWSPVDRFRLSSIVMLKLSTDLLGWIQTNETGGHPYSDTSHFEVSESTLIRPSLKYGRHFRHASLPKIDIYDLRVSLKRVFLVWCHLYWCNSIKSFLSIGKKDFRHKF